MLGQLLSDAVKTIMPPWRRLAANEGYFHTNVIFKIGISLSDRLTFPSIYILEGLTEKYMFQRKFTPGGEGVAGGHTHVNLISLVQ